MSKIKGNMVFLLILMLSIVLVLSACDLKKKDHIHEWALEWSTNEQEHWHKCKGCEETKDKASHKFEDGVCVCGKTQSSGGNTGGESEGGDDKPPVEDLKPTEGLAYVLSEDSSYAICIGYSEEAQMVENVVIANQFEGVPVKEIAKSAFMKDSTVVKLIMSDSIESLGEYSLQNCINLKEIIFSKNLKSIGECALSKSGIENIVIPSTVENMDDYVFWACPNLKKVQLDCQITDLPLGTFYQCPVVEEVTLPESLNNIVKYAFRECAMLKRLNIPDGVENIAEYAIYKCPELKELTLPEGLLSIGKYAFAYSGLEEIVIPSTVTTIGEGIFYNTPNLHTATINCEEVVEEMFNLCLALKNVNFGEKTKIIRSYAFQNCVSINELALDGNIETIENDIFYSSYVGNVKHKDSLFSLTIGSNVKVFPDSFASLGYRLVEVCNESSLTAENCKGIKNLQNYTLNYCTSKQDKGQFTNCNDFIFYTYKSDGAQKSVLLEYQGNSQDLILPTPSSVVVNGKAISEYSVANFAFDVDARFLSNNFKKVVIPAGVTEIGAYAFNGMANLEELDLGSVEHIKKFAFNGSGISKLTIPESLQSVTISAFANCINMREIEWNAINCRDLDYGTEINILPAGTGRVFSGKTGATTSSFVEKLTFGNKVQSIPAYMFEHFKNLSGEIVIPASVNYIGQHTLGYANSWSDSEISEKCVWFNFANKSGWTITNTTKDETITPNFSNENEILYYMTYPYVSVIWERA